MSLWWPDGSRTEEEKWVRQETETWDRLDNGLHNETVIMISPVFSQMKTFPKHNTGEKLQNKTFSIVLGDNEAWDAASDSEYVRH